MALYLIQNGVNKRGGSIDWSDLNSSRSPDITWAGTKLSVGVYAAPMAYATGITGWSHPIDATGYAHLRITGYFSTFDDFTPWFGIGKYGSSYSGATKKNGSTSSKTYNFDLTGLAASTLSSLQTFMYFQRYWRAGGESYGYITQMYLTKNYTISYNANGGSGAPSTQTYEESIGSETRSISSTIPTRTGFAFQGWATSQSKANAGTVDYSAGQQISLTGNLTLWAVWKGLGSVYSSASSSVQTNSDFSAAVTAYSSAYYQKIVFRKDSASGTVLATSSAFRNSLSYTIPRSWFSNYGSISSMTVVVILYTYTDSSCTTQIGSTDSRTFTVTCDAGMKPALASGVATLSPVYTGTGSSAISGLYVKGFSKVKAVFDTSKITWGAGASAGSYAIKVDDVTTSGSSTTQTSSNVVSQAGTISITYTVTDSRGLSSSGTNTITVLNYAAPTISVARCERTGALGTADENGAYITVRASASRAAVGTNAVSMTVAFRPASGSYGAETSLTGGVDLTIGGAISPDVTYFVRITATDSLGTVTELTTTLPARTWPLHLIKDGLAFGQKATEHNAARFKTGMKILTRDADLSDTGWIEPELSSEFAQYSDGDFYKVRYRRVGGVVHLAGTVKPTADIAGDTTLHTIFTLPAGYRPASTIDTICQGSTTCVWLMQVHYTGAVSFSRYRNENGYQTAGTSVWLPFYATFIPSN